MVSKGGLRNVHFDCQHQINLNVILALSFYIVFLFA